MASNLNLLDEVKESNLSEDLFYSLLGLNIHLPPLRSRGDDILFIAKNILNKFCKSNNLEDKTFSKEAISKLLKYDYPGNVRELRNVIQRASLFTEGAIRVSDLPDDYQHIDHIERLVNACEACYVNGGIPFKTVMQCLETRLLQEALKSTDGNQSEAAKKLGLKLSTFRDKLKKLESCNS